MTRLGKKIAVFLIISSLFPVFTAQAFEVKPQANMPVEGDLVVGPGKKEIFVSPGESASYNLTITNRAGYPVRVFIDIEDFTGDNETASRLLGSERGPYSLKDYVKPEKNEFILAHGEKAVLPVEVNIPQEAEPGGLYAAAIVRSEAVNPQGDTAVEDNANGEVAIAMRVASLIFVRVAGQANESGALKSFYVEKGLRGSGTMNFSFVYKNEGNVHLNPYGLIEIKNIAGKKIDEMEILPYFVMPGFSRKKDVIWDKKMLFGRYTAEIKLNRGYGNIVDSSSFAFYVIPLKVVLPVVGGALFFAFIIFLLLKKFEIRRKKE